MAAGGSNGDEPASQLAAAGASRAWLAARNAMRKKEACKKIKRSVQTLKMRLGKKPHFRRVLAGQLQIVVISSELDKINIMFRLP